MLCLSGFELHSRWVPCSIVPQKYKSSEKFWQMLETKASLTDPPSLPSFLSQPFCTTQDPIYLRNGYGTIWRSLFVAVEGRKNAPDDVRVAKKIKGKNICFFPQSPVRPPFLKEEFIFFCLPSWRQIFGGREATTGNTSALRRLRQWGAGSI